MMVRDHARPDAKRLREKIAKLEKETRECRAELESVIAHAALEGIKIEQEHHPEPPAEPAP